jgi:hypothetical protein
MVWPQDGPAWNSGRIQVLFQGPFNTVHPLLEILAYTAGCGDNLKNSRRINRYNVNSYCSVANVLPARGDFRLLFEP